MLRCDTLLINKIISKLQMREQTVCIHVVRHAQCKSRALRTTIDRNPQAFNDTTIFLDVFFLPTYSENATDIILTFQRLQKYTRLLLFVTNSKNKELSLSVYILVIETS